MTPALRKADQDLLHKLLLGQLPGTEAERLALEYADDSRLAELAESMAGKDDTLLELLRHHETVVDPDAERLVERLLERLQLGRAARPGDDTAAPNVAGAALELGSPSAAPATPPVLEQLEHYRPIKVLGQGGMGTVYLAEDTRLRREVALKTLRPELAARPHAKERFLREARLAAAIDHDHIVHIYHVGEDRGIPFLAMQLLKGTSLEDLLKRSPTLKIKQVLRIGSQIAEGLAAAHQRGMIHRDIKPVNIWIEPTGGGRVKILDFGLARISEGEVGITQSGTILGTPAYMSPEQGRGEKVDPRSDLYSLGCVLYRMATGELPLKANDTMAMLTALALTEPTAPIKVNPQIPQALSDLIMKLLAKDPNQRVGSAREVVQALKTIERGDGVAAPSATAGLSASMLQAPSQPPMLVPINESTAALEPGLPARHISPRRRRVVVLAAVAVLFASIGILFGGQIIRVVTNQGELVIAVDDPAVEVKVVQNGVVVQDKTSKRAFTLTAGKGEIEVLEKDGIKLATRQFELTRGGKTTVKVTLQELADARQPKDPAADPDRRAAEYALSIGGAVRVNEQDRDLQAAGDLPREPFRLTSVALPGNRQVKDAGLANFKDCQNLKELWLYDTQVSDAGLAYFKDWTNLTTLNLDGTHLTDAGVAHFKNCKNLTRVWLNNTSVSDVGLATFEDSKNLRVLGLCNTQVSDAGLAQFKDRKNLTHLTLNKTRLSAAGIAGLKKALPQCKIEWDGGVIEPTAKFTNSLGMEFALVPKGKAWLGGAGGKVGDKEVEIPHDFYLGVYEVTQEEWQKIMNHNPSQFIRTGAYKDALKDISEADLKRFPVEQVSWDDCQEFVTRLNEKLKETGWVYRLPTQVEWEYACRGGPLDRKEDYGFDYYLDRPTNTLLPDRANFDSVLKRPSKVGSYPANRLGLYDMHGNVSEWCADSVVDGEGTERQVFRGGGWRHPTGWCRAVFVIRSQSFARFNDTGLRLARVPIGKTATK